MPRKLPPAVRADDAIRDFFKALPRLSPSTLESKRRTLGILVKHLPHGARTTCRRIPPESFEAALKDIATGASDAENDARVRGGRGRRTGRSYASMQTDRSTLRQFARHLVHRGWVHPTFDPMYEITKSRKDTDNVTVTELRKKLKIPYDQWGNLIDCAVHPRDRLLIAALLYWGRRRSDVTVMKWRHINLETGQVSLFNVKLGRLVADGQPLPLAPALQREFGRYLEWFTARYGEPQPDWPLFPAKLTGDRVPNMLDKVGWPVDPQRPMRPADVTITIKKALAEFGWQDDDMLGQGAHTLRRSHAKEVKKRGGIAAAQYSLSHKTLSETIGYSGQDEEHEALAAVQRGFGAPEPPPEPEPEPKVEPEAKPVPDTREERLAEVVDLFSRRRVA